MASAVTKHDWAFKAVVIILGAGVLLVGFILFTGLVFRRETPIVDNGVMYANQPQSLVNQSGGYIAPQPAYHNVPGAAM